MVIGERHKHTDEGPVRPVRRTRSPRSSNGSTSGIDPTDDDSSGSEDDGGMRVGEEYQAPIPECRLDYDPAIISDSSYAMMVWNPDSESIKMRVDDYLNIATKKYEYSLEQAMALLFWHKHNVDNALADLALFTPCPDDWIIQEKVAFEQAFQVHGKQFHRILQVLPGKTMNSLIKYYYTWKKYRRNNEINVPQSDSKSKNNSTPSQEEDGAGNDTDSDFENSSSAVALNNFNGCAKDPESTILIRIRPTDTRSIVTPGGKSSSSRYGISSSNGSQRTGNKCPPGLVLDLQSLMLISSERGETTLKNLEQEFKVLKKQVETEKEIILRQKQMLGSIDAFRPQKQNPSAINPAWTMAEIQLAVLGVERYGKDYESLSEMLGTKSEDQVRAFYHNYTHTYLLDEKVNQLELKLRQQKQQQSHTSLHLQQKDSDCNKSYPWQGSSTSQSGHQTADKPAENSSRSTVKRNAAGHAVSGRPAAAGVSSYLHPTNQTTALGQTTPTTQMLNPPSLYKSTNRH